MSPLAKALIASLVLGALTGVAHAQVATPLQPAYRVDPAPARPLSLIPRADLAQSVAQADALRAAGVVRTSVDHSLASGGATASAGFLCGLQPDRNTDGGAAAYGVDPNGRFVGAKLSFAF